jgi:NAD(P)H-hydrate epimerase
MTRGYPEVPDGAFALGALQAILADVPQHSVVALGPGIGRQRSTTMLVQALLRRVDRPLVLDADGLNAVEGQADLLDQSPAPRVLTPHPGEMARLAGSSTKDVQANRMAVASEFAARHGVVVALKGAGTIVTDGRRTLANETGNPGMATGGSGDVLTGMVAGLLAQGLAPFEAACLAVRVHGRAGDLAASVLGELSLTADDVLDALPDAFLSAAPSIDPEE